MSELTHPKSYETLHKVSAENVLEHSEDIKTGDTAMKDKSRTQKQVTFSTTLMTQMLIQG